MRTGPSLDPPTSPLGSQNCTDRSFEPDISQLSLGANTTESTKSLCPSHVCLHLLPLRQALSRHSTGPTTLESCRESRTQVASRLVRMTQSRQSPSARQTAQAAPQSQHPTAAPPCQAILQQRTGSPGCATGYEPSVRMWNRHFSNIVIQAPKP